MSYFAKESLVDCSTPDEFRFSWRCAECGEVWESTPVRFSMSGVIPASDGKRIVYDTMYRREREVAMGRRSSGKSSALWRQLIPIPTTAKSAVPVAG